MDIALLSKMIGELLLDRDEVGLPGLGTFLAETVSASFSDRGYTINPPYRRVNFMPSRSEDDSLVTLYASSNGIDFDQASAIIQHFLEEVRRDLVANKIVVFPGLGRLRSTRQNHFFFITDADLDIYPDAFGLPPVSLKNHEPDDAQIRDKVAELVAFVDGVPPVPEQPVEEVHPEPEQQPGPAAEPEPEDDLLVLAAEDPAPDEPAPEAAELIAEPAHEAPAPRKRFRWWIIPLILVAVAAVSLATFVILAQAAPDFIDSLLYTPEELQILNY